MTHPLPIIVYAGEDRQKEGKMKNKHVICPRCTLSLIPNNDSPGAYPGAISRADNKTEICSACGADEALIQWMENFIAAVEDWPITGLAPLTVALISEVAETMEVE